MQYYRNCGVLALFLLLGIFQGTAATSAEEVGEGASFTTVAGVLLLVCLIAALALCAGTSVGPGIPLPAWVTTITIDPSIDKGFGGCSDGMNIINPNTVHRHRRGHFETDGAKWAVPLSSGKHVFEIYWPVKQRGTLATIGVGTEHAPLMVKPRDSLVGCNNSSWGFDIARRKILHKGQILGNLPRNGFVPDKFYMYVDCDSSTVGFGTEVEYYGAPLTVPKANYPIVPMVGSLCQDSQITMIYRGSEDRNNVRGQLNAVVVPSQMPGGAGMQYNVVNPQTVQMQHQQQQQYQQQPMQSQPPQQQLQPQQPIMDEKAGPPPAYDYQQKQ